MSKIDQQLARETQAVTRGVERFKAQLAKDKEAGREFDGPVGQRFTANLMKAMVPAVRTLQRQAKNDKLKAALTTGRRLTGWEIPILTLHAEELAYITIRTALSHQGTDANKQSTCRAIGKRCEEQLRLNQMGPAERARLKLPDPQPKYNRLEYLKRTVKQVNPKAVRKWTRRLDDLTLVAWDSTQQLHLGHALTGVLVDALPETFEVLQFNALERGSYRAVTLLQLTKEAKETLYQNYDTFADANPWYLPMVVPPKPWVALDKGGYLSEALGEKMIKVHGPANSWTMMDPEAIYTASLNAIQSKPWAINRYVATVAREAIEIQCADVLPVAPLREMPEEIAKAYWESLEAEDKGKIKRERRLIHDHNNRLESKRQMLHRQLSVAKELLDEPAIYFPHSLDFRGRAYPIPQDLHPQSDDFGRSLLRFAEAKPLGQEGFKWLQYQVATTYGAACETRDDQLEWCSENISAMKMLVNSPFGVMLDWWALADEPWQFLAAAKELVEALDHGGDDYECSLPISVDGSCNGLQHLSAMGLDPVGAHAVNLTGDPVKQDIYGIVAEKVDKAVRFDSNYVCAVARAENRSDIATNWVEHVNRKVVKRGVMTLPYGLTNIGMRDQLISDRPKTWPEVDGDVQQNANYMKDQMLTAVEGTVEAAIEIMAWMQDNAELLAKNGKTPTWTSPSGFPVQQVYFKTASKRHTILGTSMYHATEDENLGIRVGKQKLSIAPNIVHSYDAAHMAITVAMLPEDVAFAAVHDSFGCHACDMPTLLHAIKDAFVDIYATDQLAALQQDFEASRQGLEFPLIDPPARKDFMITAVYDSEWFFG